MGASRTAILGSDAGDGVSVHCISHRERQRGKGIVRQTPINLIFSMVVILFSCSQQDGTSEQEYMESIIGKIIPEERMRIDANGHITWLNLSGLGLSGSSFTGIHRLRYLRTIDLTGEPMVTDDHLEQIAKCPTIQEIAISDTGVTRDGVNKARLAIPNIYIMW